jgi:hypothetical protein
MKTERNKENYKIANLQNEVLKLKEEDNELDINL